MNVIIVNKAVDIINSVNVDIIKKLEGEHEVDEIISTFKNFYFQRMIIDITALKNYKDIKTLQKLSISLDMDKIILILENTPENVSSEYLSKLISMGIYNFTQNSEGVLYLYNNPNSYRDVAHLHHLDNATTQENTQQFVNLTGPRIIGFKNVNRSAGATTLIYMIKKQLEKTVGVVAIEMDKRDFTYFNEKDMYSVSSSEYTNAIAKYSNNSVILVDINDSLFAENGCTEVYYLIEPSTLKLNRLMMNEPKKIFGLRDKKIILNQSMLNSKDVLDFEYESKLKVYYNMPPLDERQSEIYALKVFLNKVGFKNDGDLDRKKKNGLFGLFNF
jgi:hypothetical protein